MLLKSLTKVLYGSFWNKTIRATLLQRGVNSRSVRRYATDNIFNSKTTDEWFQALNKRRNYGVLQHLGFELESVGDGGIKAKVSFAHNVS
jgi:hypothetical protein